MTNNIGPQRGPKSVPAINAEVKQLRAAIDHLPTLYERCLAHADYLDGRCIVANGEDVRDLVRENETLRAALEAIIRDQYIVGGGLANLSTTRAIAQRALDQADGGNGGGKQASDG